MSELAALSIDELLARRSALKYSPDEPRDDHGRWTSDGGGYGDGLSFNEPYNSDQSGVLRSYTDESTLANSYLRTGLREPAFSGGTDASRAAAQRDVMLLRSACRPIPKGLNVLRGVSASDLGDAEGNTMYATDAYLHGLVGSTIRDPGFMSTTTDPRVSLYANADVHLHIAVPAGTPMADIGGHGIGRYYESELLLPPRTGVRVDSVLMSNDSQGDHWDLYGKVVP